MTYLRGIGHSWLVFLGFRRGQRFDACPDIIVSCLFVDALCVCVLLALTVLKAMR